MVNSAEAIGSQDEQSEVAWVSTGVENSALPPNEHVLSAVRHLLYRYELTSRAATLPQMIAVVSGTAGEGVTTVSRALAEVLASDRNNRVCRIDIGGSDTPPPSRRRRATARAAEDGGDHDIELVRPSAPIVRMLSSFGQATVEVGSMPERRDFSDLLDGLASEFRFIVFDTPPILAGGDALGFLRHADAYLLVTRQGSSTLTQTRAIAEELRTIPGLGAILNDYQTRTPRFLRRFFSE